MSGLSLMQTRNFIDRLGDLDEEITRVCRTGETLSKGSSKGHADEVSRLKNAMEGARACQEHVRMAKETLLNFDGFLHALRPSMRQALMHPRGGDGTANFFERVAQKAGPAMGHHVGGLAEEAVECVGRVQASLRALREAEVTDSRKDDAKLSCKALERVVAAAENAIRKAVKNAGDRPEVEARSEEPVEVVEEAEVIEGGKTAHGFDLAAGGLPDFIKEKQEEREGEKKDDKKDDDEKEGCKTAGLPPEFLENAQKKKDEAAGKKDDDEKDGDEKDAGKSKKGHGYALTAGLPPEFLENAQKKKDEAAGKKDDDKDDDKSDKKAAEGVTINVTVAGGDPGKIAETIAAALRQADSKDPDPSMEDDLPGEDTDGEPVVDKSASGHGYQITAPSEHGFELSA
jgi:hypothetical protein